MQHNGRRVKQRFLAKERKSKNTRSKDENENSIM
jgi:hypothetical protein